MADIWPVTQRDMPALTGLLASSGLPTDDIRSEGQQHFLVVGDRSSISGGVGVEVYGDVGLLRSLVVSDARRGKGLGGQLADADEALAAKEGIRTLYLLTTLAKRFS